MAFLLSHVVSTGSELEESELGETDLISVLEGEGKVLVFSSPRASPGRRPILRARLPWLGAQDFCGLYMTNGFLKDEEDRGEGILC